MPVPVDRIDSFGIEAGGAANNAMNLVPFGQEKLCEVRAILTGDPGDQGFLGHGLGLIRKGSGPGIQFFGQAKIQFAHPLYIMRGELDFHRVKTLP